MHKRWLVSLYLSSFYGLNQQSIQNSGKAGAISWVVGYNRTQAENNYPFTIAEANFTGTRTNNDALFNNFNIKLEADLGTRNTLTFSSLYLSKEQGVPGGVPIPEPQFGQGFFNSLTENNRKYTDQVLTDLTWNSKLGNGNDSLLTIILLILVILNLNQKRVIVLILALTKS